MVTPESDGVHGGRLARRVTLGVVTPLVLAALVAVGYANVQHPTNTTTSTLVATSTTSTTTTTLAPVATIAAVGDTELGNTPQLPPDLAAYMAPVVPALAAPIVFGNLEGTMTDATTSKCSSTSTFCYAFRVPPSFAEVYRRAGFNVLNSANNHSNDYGASGVADTSSALRAAGITQAGLAGQIGVVRDGSLKVAFVDFAPYASTNNLLDFPAAAELIRHAKSVADLVVVYMHAGAEGPDAAHVTRATETFVGENRGNPYAFAHAAINDGADLVIASGPHVLRGLEWYRGHLIDYSLGDFANYYNFATSGDLRYSAILKVTLDAAGSTVRANFTSLVLSPSGQPSVDPTRSAAQFVNLLSHQDFANAAAVIAPDGNVSLPVR
ncbi:MAG TPA: CapA family protein [Acidimicrobiales bacterium]|nr:CapA family protein [Acidimicrobiales bacterium]